MKTPTHAAPPVDLDRLVLLLNEAYVFLGMPHKALRPWRIALGEWQAKVEKDTGWNHFAEVKKFEQNAQGEAVVLRRLVRQLQDINSALMEEMCRQYPIGARVVFWRSANQRRESFGTVVSHTTAHVPELRVRYDGSRHVVGLHVGYTKFHSLPNAGDHPAGSK